MPDFKHSLILLARRFQIDSHRKVKFFKAIASKLFAVLLSVYVNFVIYSIYEKNPQLFGGAGSLLQNFGSPEFFKTIAICTVKNIILSMIFFIVIFIQISSVIPSFYDESRLVRREIAVESYSTGSYFCSLLFYFLIIESIVPFIAFLISIAFIPITDEYSFMAYMLTSFFTIPFSLCIGSITTTKQFVLILSSIFSTLAGIPPSTIATLNEKFGINSEGVRNKLSYITYLCLIMTPYFFVAFVSYLSAKEGCDALERFGNVPMISDFAKGTMTKNLLFIDMRPMSLSVLMLLMLLSPIFCIAVGIVLLGLNLMPEIRMKLEKNYVDKRQ